MNTRKAFPVILVTGSRQVGKTTMLEKLAEAGRRYVTLDNPMIRDIAINDPALFMQRYVPPISIDEIQYAPQLLPYIKMYVVEHKNKGDFWLIGSQMMHLMKNVRESLAGRVGVINILGLSISEILGYKSSPYSTDFKSLNEKLHISSKLNLREVYDRIFKGSRPSLYEVDQVSNS